MTDIGRYRQERVKELIPLLGSSRHDFHNFFLPQTSKIIAAGGDYPYSADGQGALGAAASKGGTGNKSNVIRAVIDKLWYPINVEVLYKVCVLYSIVTTDVTTPDASYFY